MGGRAEARCIEPTIKAASRPTVQPAKNYRVQAFPPDGQPYLIAPSRVRVDQGSRQEGDRRQSPARCRDPRQGHRGGNWPRLARSQRAVHTHGEPRQRRHGFGFGHDRGQQEGWHVPDHRTARQGAPVRLRPHVRLYPRGDWRPYDLQWSARRSAPLRPRHHPLRGQGRRPATRDHRRAAAGQDHQGPRGRAQRRDGRARR